MSAPRAGLLAGLAAALVFVMGAAAPARAALPLTLAWDAPAGCPSAEVVRAELERLASFPAGQTPPKLVAEAHIEKRDGRWRLRLRTVRDGAPGERELEAESCASLAHAATLVMALAFGVAEPEAAPPPPPAVPERPRPSPRPREAEPTLPEPPPAPPVVEAPPPPAAPPPKRVVVVVAPERPARAPTVWSVAAGARLSNGPLPGVDGGAEVGLDARVGRLVASLRLDGWLPTDGAIAGTSARMQVSGAGVTFALCGVALDGARVTLGGCASASGAALVGASTGGLTQRSATAPWYAAGGGLRARVRLIRKLHLESRCEAAVSLTRPRFSLTNRGDVYTVPAVVPAVTVGLSVDL